MRLTRRQVLRLAAAQGVLLSLPRAAVAMARVSPGDGFVGAVRVDDELAVASTRGAGRPASISIPPKAAPGPVGA